MAARSKFYFLFQYVCVLCCCRSFTGFEYLHLVFAIVFVIVMDIAPWFLTTRFT